MQLLASAPTATAENSNTQPLLNRLRSFLLRRTFIGFRVGEALLWFAFVVMWPTILGSIYFFGGVFESGASMPIDEFILNSTIVSFTKAIVIIPFWWVIFIYLRNMPLLKRTLFHPLLGSLYAVIVVSIVQQIKTKILLDDYYGKAVLSDMYNLLTAYFMNFILFHAYNFWLHTQRQQKKEQELRELAFQSEINALKTQIEPHFFFNTLNSISASVPPTLEKTRVLIAQLADTFRYALRVSESQFVPLADELEFLKTWLALEKQRFGERLIINYQVHENVLSVMVPPMILQPIVENALNHGLSPKISGGTVTIKCEAKPDSVYIAVSDTGVGYSGDLDEILNKSVGLNNISRRLRLLYNQPLNVHRQHEGLLFSFHIPLQAA